MLSMTISASAQTAQVVTQPAYSIDLSTPPQSRPPNDTTTQQKAGSVAQSSVGIAGQRQEKAQGIANIRPMDRINTRIANRVQSRIRNRIDRFYDPAANTTSPFKAAAEQGRAIPVQ